MSRTNRVVWQQGMFMRTQYFQQQERRIECLVCRRVLAVRLCPSVEYALDRKLLGPGRFALLIAELSRVPKHRGETLAAGAGDARHDAKQRCGEKDGGRSLKRTGRGGRFVEPGKDHTLSVLCRLAERHPARGRCRAVRAEWRAGSVFQPPASPQRGHALADRCGVLELRRLAGRDQRRDARRRCASGFRSVATRCHRGSAGEWTRSTVPLVRNRDAAIKMSDLVRGAASIGPSPDAERWPLLQSWRGLRA